MDVLQRGRDVLMDELADLVLDQADDLLESGFAFHEFLENQGTRLHFLCLLLSQLEQSAEVLDEQQTAADEPTVVVEPPAPAPEPSVSNVWDIDLAHPAPAAPPEPPARKRRTRSRGKKLERQSSREGSPEDA